MTIICKSCGQSNSPNNNYCEYCGQRFSKPEDNVSRKEIIEFAERINKLSKKEIDELWCKCGFVCDESLRKKGYKALSEDDIIRIDEGLDGVIDMVEFLLEETPILVLKKNLLKIEF